MSWRDRPYSDEPPQPQMNFGFRKPSRGVIWLLIANGVAFLVTSILFQNVPGSINWLSLQLEGFLQGRIWQLGTYMFLHAGTMHLLFNMIGLYIFGSEFERAFGRNRFLQFYFLCGILGGIAYLLLGWAQPDPFRYSTLVGASGAVYGLLMAAIIFFPHIQVIVLIFPMPIRVFGLLILAIFFLKAASGEMTNLGGEACHFGGALAGLAILYQWGMLPKIGGKLGGMLPESPLRRARSSEGAWARKQKKLAEQDAEIDRILEKVHQQGLQSLSRREKKILSQATRRQQEREQGAGRSDRL